MQPQAPAEAPAVAPGRPHYEVYRTAVPITLDGQLDEASWRQARPAGPLPLYDGNDAPHETFVRLLWDAQFLYIAFECDDPDIYATFTERDEALYSQDVVEVFISRPDPNAAEQGHFIEYEFSPAGVLFDSYLTAPFKGRLEWTADGLAAAGDVRGTPNKPADRDGGYTVEIAIPFASIYRDPSNGPAAGNTQRANLYRIDYSTPAPDKIGQAGTDAVFYTWSPTGKINFHMPQKFGTDRKSVV